MRIYRRFLTTPRRSTRYLLGILLLISVAAIIVACGKLKDDSDRPYTPSGSSGGQLIPQAPPSALGNHSFSLTTDDSSIPADGVSYTTLHAKLTDSSGRSVEGLTITFDVISSDQICLFLQAPIVGPSDTGALGSTIMGLTGANGGVSVRLYGIQAGSCVIRAKAGVTKNTTDDLRTTVGLSVTAASGIPGDGTEGLLLTSEILYQQVDAGDCEAPEAQEASFEFTAHVWDLTGRPVQNARVELSGDISQDSQVWNDTTASDGRVSFNITYSGLFPGYYTFTIKGRTIIDGKTYTDTITFYVSVTCTVPEATPVPALTLELLANPEPIPFGINTSDIAITVKDPDGNILLEPVTITLNSTAGTITPSTLTVNNGVGNATFNGSGLARPYKVMVYAVATSTNYSGGAELELTLESSVPSTPTPVVVGEVLTVKMTAGSIASGSDTAVITIVITDSSGAPLASAVSIDLTTTAGTLSADPVSITGAGTVTLDIAGVTPRPPSVTVFGVVAESGYTGNGNVSITVAP